jgi:HK97 family phage major capsid protein
MSTQLFEMKKQRTFALKKAENILVAAELAHRGLTAEESVENDTYMGAVKALNPQIAAIESKNTIQAMFPNGRPIIDIGGRGQSGNENRVLSEAYSPAFHEYVASGGKKMESALYEGSDGAGGFAVPVVVDRMIVPLAPAEMAIRRLAMVIPTSMDIKVPRKGTFGVAHPKAENAVFIESDPTLEQFTLSAFLAGIQQTISWELAQDVPAFRSFCVTDMLIAQAVLEESYYASGTGTGQPQGLIGNVGAGVTEEPDSEGNLVSINGTLNLLGTLNEVYHDNASWLMTRATSIIIRKAQAQANLFNPIWTYIGKQNFLHGYPVEFSASMPTAARGNCPVLFGDFKAGYVIGDRGGTGINVKILDQPAAQQGQIILLAYSRTDGRVRRSEAIQAYNIAST